MSGPTTLEEDFRKGRNLLDGGRIEEAEKRFRAMLLARPEWAQAQYYLGLALRRRGKIKEALENLNLSAKLAPTWAEAHNTLGATLYSTGSVDEALEHFRRAVQANPNHINARRNLGLALADKGLYADAAAAYRQVLSRNPDSTQVHNLLGIALAHQGKSSEAIEHYQRALARDADYADPWNNLGNALHREGKLDEADAALRTAIRLKPNYAEAYNNLANVLLRQERFDEALVNYRMALRLNPDYANAHMNLGLTLLLRGDFANGWREYEWRRKTKDVKAREFSRPQWDGGALAGKTILLFAEQGLGDTLQFIRYSPLVERHGGTVVVECQPALVPLLRGHVARLVARGQPLPEFDVEIPLLSLPGLFGSTLPTMPNSVPYLTAEPARVDAWRERLQAIKGFKIGIAWQGSTSYQEDRWRSIKLRAFAPLARIPGVRLISLQKGFGTEQLQEARDWAVVDFGTHLDQDGAFLDSAAILKQLDLVVTSDTAVAHLAGALGVPVWVALTKIPDWRWLLHRPDSPWYPSMKLFRQIRADDWDELFGRMAKELECQPALESAEKLAERGTALLRNGQAAAATKAFERAQDLAPATPDLQYKLALAVRQSGKKDHALELAREAVRLAPGSGEAHELLGSCWRDLGRLAEAEAALRRAHELLPNSADLCYSLAVVLLEQAKHEEAETWLRRCLRLQPDRADAYHSLGVLFKHMGKLAESIAAYERSLQLSPNSPNTQRNLALALLMLGDYARGWPEYEARWSHPSQPTRSFDKPRWDGRPLTGQAVLLYAEQGLGDAIQFVRYAALVKQRGGHVIVEVVPALQALLSRCPGIDRFVPEGEPLPDFAYHVPLLSLPAVFHTTLETVPADVPYLSADPMRMDFWRKELESLDGIKVGIAWQGNRKFVRDADRSPRLVEFEPLARVPGVRLISLQKGWGAGQLNGVRTDWPIVSFGERLDAEAPFVDTAAIIANLDLVITSDSALAHVAGALGARVWVALSKAPNWRWLLERQDSPWYPTMRLFRQSTWGQWGDVFRQMATELQRLEQPFRAGPILAEIGPGELLDKITILEIKRARTKDADKLRNIYVELGVLLAVRARALKPSARLDQLVMDLKRVNEQLWEIEDDIRVHERNQDFGPRFVELARSVYHKNDERAALKRQINNLYGSSIVEEKSYAPSRRSSGVPS